MPTWGLSVFCDFCGFSDSFAVKPKRGGGLRKFIEKIFGLAFKNMWGKSYFLEFKKAVSLKINELA